ncbi:hypothetical protein FXO38_03981 [Capsicum annuum]|nr:hypothetical protein FXO37_06940 [Capsicum annuum]KAF3677080.1 hypothetical protein FXO38_03981 [Capsicum annuum]
MGIGGVRIGVIPGIGIGKISVKEYALKFHQLSWYALEMVSSMRDRMRKFAFGLSRDLILESKAALSIKDMDISSLVMYLQKGGSLDSKGKFVSYLKVRRLIYKGSLYHLVWVKGSNSDGLFLHSILVVNEFPDELLGVPPDKEIEFRIDFVSDSRSISMEAGTSKSTNENKKTQGEKAEESGK